MVEGYHFYGGPQGQYTNIYFITEICILVHAETYSSVVRVKISLQLNFTPVQQYVSKYRNVNFSTKIYSTTERYLQ